MRARYARAIRIGILTARYDFSAGLYPGKTSTTDAFWAPAVQSIAYVRELRRLHYARERSESSKNMAHDRARHEFEGRTSWGLGDYAKYHNGSSDGFEAGFESGWKARGTS